MADPEHTGGIMYIPTGMGMPQGLSGGAEDAAEEKELSGLALHGIR